LGAIGNWDCRLKDVQTSKSLTLKNNQVLAQFKYPKLTKFGSKQDCPFQESLIFNTSTGL
ncbi:MAG: hypothetical protein DRR19_22130, partial [Candidatus Parabeggiatoa sp. nov. 1]